jgi:hypothetical protein
VGGYFFIILAQRGGQDCSFTRHDDFGDVGRVLVVVRFLQGLMLLWTVQGQFM